MKHRLVLFQVTLQIVEDSQFFVQTNQSVSKMLVVNKQSAMVKVCGTLRT